MAQFDSDAVVPEAALSRPQSLVLMTSVLVVALCGIVYELIIAAVASYLLGNSVYQFSITIGLFMFAMGVGSYLTKWINDRLVSKFIAIEIAVALIGGVSSSLLFLLFPFPAFYRPVMFLLMLVIGILVGLEIPILTRILSEVTTWKKSIAHVLSLDYLGALVGSVSFPILMLPTLGLFRSSFAIGLLNIGVAFLALATFGRSLERFWRLLLFSLLVLGTLVGGLGMSEWLNRFAEQHMYADNVIHISQTPYQRIVVTENARTKEIRLYLDKHIQFASIDEHRYHESLVHPVMSAPGSRAKVLVLGGGDGMAVREILKYPDVKNITMVDIDPQITKLCASFGPIKRLNQGALESDKLTIVNEDAFAWLLRYIGNENLKSRCFDRVIIDLPDPHNEALDKLYSKEFYEILRRCMTPDGFMVCQSSSPFFARDVYWCIRTTMEAAAFEVRSFKVPMVSFGIWGFHLCASNPNTDWTLSIDPTKCHFLDDDVFKSCTQFGRDIARVKTPVNRTFEPKLYTLYERSMRE